MTRQRLRLDEAPSFVFQSPQCSACIVDLDADGDGYTCPSCGTSWDTDASDGDVGELYESWAGETPTGPVCPADEAWQVSHLDDEKRDAAVAALTAG